MSDYKVPVKDMRFAMGKIVGLAEIRSLPGFEDATPDMADAILEEAARFTSEALAPLNCLGDTEGCKLGANGVVTPAGWKEAYKAFCDGGWNGMGSPAAFGGQGLPETIGIAVKEMTASANLSFSLCSMLTGGAVAALLTCASDELKTVYLDKMITGEWSATMNLTEPNAGSDLALIRSRAESQADGSYRVFGQKIFITYGDHDMTDNIVQLVHARLPAPVVHALSGLSRWCLVVAIAALGVKTSFQQLAALGWRPVLMLVVDTVFLAGLILGGLMLQH